MKQEYRKYNSNIDNPQAKFYKEQHTHQTFDFNIEIREKIANAERIKLSMWDALERLDKMIDPSDPDTLNSQLHHGLQAAEQARSDGKPDWFQVVCLIHDAGKMLNFLGMAEQQWAVVGDTFVVGSRFAPEIVYGIESFLDNPDLHDPRFNTLNGVYSPNCGLENVLLSYGHDEYLFGILKAQSTLPRQALEIVRYHSFYPWHDKEAYMHLCSAEV